MYAVGLLSARTTTPTIMAAPMKQQCIVCSSTSKRLYSLNNNKARKANSFNTIKRLVVDFPQSITAEIVHSCDKCLSFLQEVDSSIYKISANVVELVSADSGKKRQASTPVSALKKKSTVAEQLTLSVEKLKKLNIEDSHYVTKRSKRKISFEGSIAPQDTLEHAYFKPCASESTSRSQEATEQLKLRFSELPSTDFSDIHSQLTELATMKSILFSKNGLTLSSQNTFCDAVTEMQSGCPMLFDCLRTALGSKISHESKVATMGTMYGMILHSRNNQVSAIQRLYTSVALRYNADNKLLTKLNKVHISLTEDSKRTIIGSFGKESEEGLIREIANGANGKFNGDNLDIRFATNDMRMKQTDRDYHFFATDFTLDRVKTDHLDRHDHAIESVAVESFILKAEEKETYLHSLKYLLGREMAKIEAFKWMESIIPKHIPHPLQEQMSQRSKIFILPVSLNNEAYYSDCVKIMDECESNLNRWYTKSGRVSDLEQLYVPFGGDQLTRVRLQGAKSLRAGAHSASQRFDHLHPVIIEMFHTLQDFLEKLCKKFLNLNCGRDAGTLPNLKILIQRANVNGNVKSRFKAHEDFVLTCGQGYLYSYILKKFKMKDLNDQPEHPTIKETITSWNNAHKLKVFNTVMDEVVKEIFIPFDFQGEIQKEITVSITTLTQPPSTIEVKSQVSQQKQ